jgi:two-component system LytT family response regulator
MKKYKALIVDDETLARSTVKQYLSEHSDIEICGECEDGFECLRFLANQTVDILFLDIQMPKLSGFEVLELLPEKPAVIFTTAFDQYAIKAFEINAADYLLKPYSKDRFLQAVNKCIEKLNSNAPVVQYTQLTDTRNDELSRIVVRNGNKVEIILTDDILFLESNENYVNIHTRKGIYVKDKTMKFFEDYLPKNQFMRLHRGYIANLNEIASIEAYTKDSYQATMKNGEKIKVSQDGYKRFRAERL